MSQHHNKLSCIFALFSDCINCLANVTETVAQYTDNTTNIKFLNMGELVKSGRPVTPRTPQRFS